MSAMLDGAAGLRTSDMVSERSSRSSTRRKRGQTSVKSSARALVRDERERGRTWRERKAGRTTFYSIRRVERCGANPLGFRTRCRRLPFLSAPRPTMAFAGEYNPVSSATDFVSSDAYKQSSPTSSSIKSSDFRQVSLVEDWSFEADLRKHLLPNANLLELHVPNPNPLASGCVLLRFHVQTLPQRSSHVFISVQYAARSAGQRIDCWGISDVEVVNA